MSEKLSSAGRNCCYVRIQRGGGGGGQGVRTPSPEKSQKYKVS